MNLSTSFSRTCGAAAVALALGLAAGSALAADTKLDGSEEVPPVTTSATGENMVKVAADGAVSGKVTTKGIDATAAHIHNGAKGKNGPVIIPLKKGDGGDFMVPADAKLTEAQMKDYKDGNLYVNVHSAAHPGGEIRDQMEP
ncbi:MAG: CHRD domain-containing protein [Burkholderiales bacterium]